MPNNVSIVIAAVEGIVEASVIDNSFTCIHIFLN